MKFMNVEIQTDANGNVARLVSDPLKRSLAEQDYHTRLSYAAVSGLPCHSVSMLDAEGRLIKREEYKPIEDDEED